MFDDAQTPPGDEDDTQARLNILKSRYAPKQREEEAASSVTPTKQEPVKPPQPPPVTYAESRIPPPAPIYEVREQKKGGKPGPPTARLDRKKFTIYLGEPEMQALEEAYKKMAHDLYPQEIEKADFLEACFTYLCESYQQEQIRKRLQDK